MSRALALVLTLVLTVPAAGGELAGVSFEDTLVVGEQRLVLNGLGLRKKAFIKVYVAGLYLPERQADSAKILAGDTPRRLVMSFLYKVSADKLVDAWNDGLENNVSGPGDTVRKGFAQLNGWMEDMGKGEQMTFTYVPGTGTEVSVLGKTQGTIAGKDFADALFSCWLGPKPPSTDFKRGLLGQG